MRFHFYLLIFNILSISFSSIAQITPNQEELWKSFNLFREMLAIPNDAHDLKQSIYNVRWCEKAFKERNFSTVQLETPGAPLLLAEYNVKNESLPTVLVYLQIDGQPVDPSFWWQRDPYVATLKKQSDEGDWQEIPWENLQNTIDPEWRIFARSASDAKGPAAIFLTALDLLHKYGHSVAFNLKVIMDFEEELGSPHLPGAVEVHKDLLSADHLVIFDGPPHMSNEPTLSFGARGITDVSITVYGPEYPVHSGNYGNFAPNPVFKLSRLLSSMKDEEGRVLIPGWYDGIDLDEATLEILRAVPDNDNEMRFKMGFAEAEKVTSSFQEAMQYPTLNVRGLQSAWVGKDVRTIIPATALAEIDIRTVIESNPEVLLSKLRNHIENQGFQILDGKPTKKDRMTYPNLCTMTSQIMYEAFRTPLDGSTGQWLRHCMKKATGKDPVMIRVVGGSIPIAPFVNTLEVPAVTVPTVNPDNNQHSPNENIRLGNYLQGIEIITTILSEPVK
ncbi:MAG TPA: M20/M25/M40 family metallo-hydrolase [Saprospiraceae bacterium]|nr:M20/M25/M40 family metallo-hydrolase [Saprospiraceae bacterium]